MKYVLIFILSCLLFSCKNNSGGLVTINLDLKNIPEQKILLVSNDAKSKSLTVDSVNYIVDSTNKKNDKIVLKTKTNEPTFLQIVFVNDASKGKFIPIATNGESITITGDYNDLKKVSIAGSEDTKSLLNFLNTNDDWQSKISEKANQIDALEKGKKDSTFQNLEKELANLNVINFENKVNYARKATNPVNAIIGLQTLQNLQQLTQVKPLMDSLHKKFEHSTYFNNAFESYSSLFGEEKKVTTKTDASVAKEISLPDVDGNMKTLSSYKGKYVLVDFWASWCGPCRNENPNVVTAYQKFKDKNFIVFGISLDDDKNKWLKAIKEDKLIWTQVSDLKGWYNQAAQDYEVKSIPANFLIDTVGNIIAKDLRGNELESKLNEVLK